MRFNQVEFGRRLKALRKERGMTQEELAAALSITPNHLGKIELGKRGISFDVLLGVSEVLDISLDVLIKGKRHSYCCRLWYAEFSRRTRIYFAWKKCEYMRWK